MYLGIDFGTSGCRASVIDQQQQLIAEASQPLAPADNDHGRLQQSAAVWLQGLARLLAELSTQLELTEIRRLAIDGTSGTILLCDRHGRVLTPALMYNDASSSEALAVIAEHCPEPEHITLSPSSGLVKALQLAHSRQADDFIILSQADYLSNYLAGTWGISDYHNALKLGYDVEHLQWPEWISDCIDVNALPRVLEPGQVFATIDPTFAAQFGLAPECQICAGSTDANAAFIATGCDQLGDAVTSLGTTLVVKLLNDQPVQDLATGVYSHRLGQRWLCGGASNAGAGILREYFTDLQLQDYSTRIDLEHPSGLDYYPLPATGERFPLNDPHKQPVITPRPESDVVFLQALLEGLSRIEGLAYARLIELGARSPRRILTSGGGAGNPQWAQMRQQLLGIPVAPAQHTQASYGSAVLACRGLQAYEQPAS